MLGVFNSGVLSYYLDYFKEEEKETLAAEAIRDWLKKRDRKTEDRVNTIREIVPGLKSLTCNHSPVNDVVFILGGDYCKNCDIYLTHSQWMAYWKGLK